MTGWLGVAVASVVAVPLLMAAPQSCSVPAGPDQARVPQRNGTLLLTLKFGKDGHISKQGYVSTRDVPQCTVGASWPRCTGEW